MNIAQIEENLQNLMKNLKKESFIYDLLLAYGTPKSMIARMQKGSMNLAKEPGEVLLKTKLHFKEVDHSELHGVATELVRTGKHDPRFVVVTDYKNLVAIDTKTLDKLDVALKSLPKHFDFFLPWAGMEKAQHANENPADVKAAERMAKLFDAIKKENPDDSPEFIHGLNVFLSRLLFCYFAEDTNIFAQGQFTNAISSHTQVDGSDLHTYLDTLFDVLNTPENKRKKLPDYLNKFPYVNGGLFRKHIAAPMFTRRSRQVIIDAGELVWSAINPDIFGSMFQAVIGADQRGTLGQHYTSVPNILKVIEPLFLNELKEAFESAKGSTKKLNDLLTRIAKIKIFDPACGSGNFLIIAYKELRRLEMQIFEELNRVSVQQLRFTSITLDQFYGIEIDDFAHEIALLSLWLAEHQMNVEFFKAFGNTTPTLPLKETGNIVQGNACRLDWEKVCPKGKEDEVYVLGNPPYLGSSIQDDDQKSDLGFVCKGFENFKNLDYIACWFVKGAQYIKNSCSKYAFVSTNSICQGEQVALLWPFIFAQSLEIGFAHRSFKWSNNAKSKAGVTCVIIGVQQVSKELKLLVDEGMYSKVQNINSYLANASNVIVEGRRSPISFLPPMLYGNKPADGGHLILSEVEYKRIIQESPEATKFLKRLVGSDDFINGDLRYCIWVDKACNQDAVIIPEFKKRFEAVRTFRSNSTKQATVKLSEVPYQFAETRYSANMSILVPIHTSERRNYVPFGFFDGSAVISNAAQAIYDPETWLFSLISSRMHMTWIRAVCGSLETRIRYSSTLGYDVYPKTRTYYAALFSKSAGLR